MKRFKALLQSLACHAHAFLFSYMTRSGLILCEIDPKSIEAEIRRIGGSVDGFIKAQKERFDKFSERQQEQSAQLLEIEQKLARDGAGPALHSHGGGGQGAQIVKALTDSPMFDAFVKGEVKSVAVRVPLDIRAATITSTTSIVDTERDSAILRPLERKLTIRDLLPVIPTTQSAVEYTRETGFTNNADIQASEGDAKAESGLTFDLQTAHVRTIAHWTPASRQVLEDRNELQTYVESRLLYGLKLKEEAQLLLGSGVGVNLNGIYTQATAFNRSGGNKLDTLRRAITQLQLAEATPTGIVLNPEDWEDIELGKATDGQYITVVANNNGREVAWRLPVVVTNSITPQRFLVGDFARGAAIRDRQEARVEISREHEDFFVRNLVALLCEERIALTVFRPISFVKGDFGS